MTPERLTADEDGELRRLHWFEGLGCELSSALRTIKQGFRSRDRRAAIREPGAAFDGGTKPAESTAVDQQTYWV